MKICIVTVYNSINSGSFWQARALGILLEKLGHEVYYYKRNTGSASKLNQLKEVLKKIAKLKFRQAITTAKDISNYNKASKIFKVISKDSEIYKNIDCFILGSDTIWNTDNKYFYENYKKYFGQIFENKKIISYAPSVANTSYEKLNRINNLSELINNIESISVRDNRTCEIIKKFTSKSVTLVCDPTMLLSKSDYKLMEQKPIEKNDYIFLYLFENLSIKNEDELKQFAKKNNLKIYSRKQNNKFADKCVENSPSSFLNYMLNAKYVITDTFHGTIFSINLEKEFVVIDRNKNKVNEVVERLGMRDRLINPIESNIIEKLENKINYEKIRRYIEEYRNNSIKFLTNALK